MDITSNKDGSVCMRGKPEELVLFNKLSEEWDLFYGELKARGISISDMLTSRKGKNANEFLKNILGINDNKSKEDKEK